MQSPYEDLVLLYLPLSCLSVLLKRTALFLKGNKEELNLVERVSEDGLKWIKWLGCIIREKNLYSIKK